MRTTIDIDDPILEELKRLQRREGKSLGRLVSDLLAQALAAQQRSSRPAAPVFKWIARPMHARVDLDDEHALLDLIDDMKAMSLGIGVNLLSFASHDGSPLHQQSPRCYRNAP